MDIRKVKKLIELLEESDVYEIEIHEGEESVRISRQGATVPAAAMQPIMQPVWQPEMQASGQGAPGHAAAGPANAESAGAATPPNDLPPGTVIPSPMVGTFYRSSAPGAAAFVEEGKSVSKGETICIIEAMKILNQIESEVSGTVRAILVQDGQPVEYGEPLMVVD